VNVGHRDRPDINRSVEVDGEASGGILLFADCCWIASPCCGGERRHRRVGLESVLILRLASMADQAVPCAIRSPDRPFAARIMSAARSPMTTHGAMVLPVVIRGMIDASAMRRLSKPYTRS
jgi:hypothetical protein